MLKKYLADLAILVIFLTFIIEGVFPDFLCNAKEGQPLSTKKVIVYYFHGNYRCPTCLMLERLSKKAVTENFSKELSSGLLEYRSVNVDEPENRHFVDDFGLFTKSLVLVEKDGRKTLRYKNLGKIWILVRDEAAFKNYVKDEVEGFLKKVLAKTGKSK